MDSAKNSFISSTFWTERIGQTAGLKTLEVMEQEKSWKTLFLKMNSQISGSTGKKWRECGK